ncbi:MAG: hypothetical protein ACAF42_03200 [Limnothrix sp. BL-A-16]
MTPIRDHPAIGSSTAKRHQSLSSAINCRKLARCILKNVQECAWETAARSPWANPATSSQWSEQPLVDWTASIH